MCFHGRCLWLNRKISVGVELITLITGLSLERVDPTPSFFGKDQDTTLVNQINEKYDLTRDKRGFLISSINDTVVRFAAKVLSNKLLQKMRLNQCTIGTIATTKQCVAGV